MARHNKKQALLAVTEGGPIARQIVKLTSELFDVLSARDGAQAALLLASRCSISVIVVESKIGQTSGVEILEMARSQRPDVRRVLLTEYRDLSAVVHGVHSGAIEQLLEKPLREPEFLAAIRRSPGQLKNPLRPFSPRDCSGDNVAAN